MVNKMECREYQAGKNIGIAKQPETAPRPGVLIQRSLQRPAENDLFQYRIHQRQ